MSVAVSTAPQRPPQEEDHDLSRRLYRLSVAQYHRLIEAGILTDNDRVELLHGWLIAKMPINPPHNIAITRINRRLLPLLPEPWLLQVQGAITLRDSEPEPDFAVIRGPEETYDRRKPVPRDIALLIEVADSSLLPDRRDKGILYAQARVPQFWIVNLVEAVIEGYTEPKAGKSPAYRQQRTYGADESIPLVLEGQTIALIPVRDFLPR
jgi:Uma2 family endonuclease